MTDANELAKGIFMTNDTNQYPKRIMQVNAETMTFTFDFQDSFSAFNEPIRFRG
jgi:hypothetical protein